MKGPFSALLAAGLVKDLPDYTSAIAEEYDAIEGRREEDLPFYRKFLNEPGLVVDLGCGTEITGSGRKGRQNRGSKISRYGDRNRRRTLSRQDNC